MVAVDFIDTMWTLYQHILISEYFFFYSFNNLKTILF